MASACLASSGPQAASAPASAVAEHRAKSPFGIAWAARGMAGSFLASHGKTIPICLKGCLGWPELVVAIPFIAASFAMSGTMRATVGSQT
jgi:hypothetical protein